MDINQVAAIYYREDAEELRKNLHSLLPAVIKLDSTIHIGMSRPSLLFGIVYDWYVNIANGLVYIKIPKSGWRSLDKILKYTPVVKQIYTYSKERPLRPTASNNYRWSSIPLEVMPIKRSIWVSQANFVGDKRVGFWSKPSIYASKITHDVTDPLYHSPAKAPDYGKFIRYNPSTGAVEAIGLLASFGVLDKNLVLASHPTDDGEIPTFRALVAADIPDLSSIYHTGTLTQHYIPKAASSLSLTNSVIYENDDKIGIKTVSPERTLDINGNLRVRMLGDGSTYTYLLTANVDGYIDRINKAALITGLQPKDMVAAATTANITLANLQDIDDVTGVENIRILVKNQTNKEENGIYLMKDGTSWVRTSDTNTWDEMVAAYVLVDGGKDNGGWGFYFDIQSGGTLETDDILIVPFYKPGTTEIDPIFKAWRDTQRTANTFYSGPASGADAIAAFRSLVAADIPALGNISNLGAIGTTTGLVVVTGTSGVLTTQSRSGIDSRSTFPPSSHTHGNITNDGKIGSTTNLVVTTTTDGLLTATSRSGIDSRSTFPPDSHALGSHSDTSGFSDANPLMNGTAGQGSSDRLSRQDHVHPTDTTRQVGHSNLTSLSGLTYPSAASFVKMTGVDTFALDTNTYLTSLPSHAHGHITNAGAIGSTANLPVITTTSGVLTTGSFGTGAYTFCQGNDSRLSDARTPTSHNLIDTTGHTVSGLETGHFLKATGATTYGFAAHGLTASNVGAIATSHTVNNISNGPGFLKNNGTGTWSYDNSTYLTGNQSISLTGDVTGTGTTSIPTTFATARTNDRLYRHANNPTNTGHSLKYDGGFFATYLEATAAVSCVGISNEGTITTKATYYPSPVTHIAAFPGDPNSIRQGMVSRTVAEIRSDIGAMGSALTSTYIFVGNGSNVATGVTLSLNATAGTFALSNTGVLTMPNATTSLRGLLTSTDWNTFNSKLSSTLSNTYIFVGNGSNVATGVVLSLSASAGTFALANTGVLTMPNATASLRGLLTSTDWNTFNGKMTAPSGTTNQTLRHDGSAWVASTNLTNNNAVVSIDTGSLYVKANVSYVNTFEVANTSGSTIFSVYPSGLTTITNGSLSLSGTGSSTVGVLFRGSDRFLHNYGTESMFAGVRAGNFTLTGSYNVGIGYGVLESVSSGYNNTGAGKDALRTNTTGYVNTAVGFSSMKDNTTGHGNTSVGSNSLQKNTTGILNLASGVHSMHENTTGSYNTAYGINALQVSQTENYNTAIGYRALPALTSGGSNVVVGRDSGYFYGSGIDQLTTAVNCTYIGASVNASANSVQDEIAIGRGAIGNGSYTATIGNSSVTGLFLAAGCYVYFGADANNSWRIGRSGNNLVIERKESNTWQPKSTITP